MVLYSFTLSPYRRRIKKLQLLHKKKKSQMYKNLTKEVLPQTSGDKVVCNCICMLNVWYGVNTSIIIDKYNQLEPQLVRQNIISIFHIFYLYRKKKRKIKDGLKIVFRPLSAPNNFSFQTYLSGIRHFQHFLSAKLGPVLSSPKSILVPSSFLRSFDHFCFNFTCRQNIYYCIILLYYRPTSQMEM